VLLVHGFGGTKSNWSFIARTLSAQGLTVDAMTYTPFATSVEQLADRLVVEVERLLSQTGADKVQSCRTQPGWGGHRAGHRGGVVSQGWSTRSSPSRHRSRGRHGRTCCRSGRLSGRCGKDRPYCADSPPRRYPTACGGWHSRPHST
jgi:hypothetical protein